jgi:hypothetical protein
MSTRCITLECDNKAMTNQEREKEFFAGWVGITMYEDICLGCFAKLKEER